MPPRPSVPLDVFRLQVLRRDTATNSFNSSFEYWLPTLEQTLTDDPTAEGVWQVGERLRDAFRSRPAGRSQSDLSVSGTAFEGLLSWYLNLMLWGTNIVAARNNQKSVPESIRHSTTVMMGTTKSNTETDLVLFSVPTASESSCEPLTGVERVDQLLSRNIKQASVVVLQAKTNWRDNAQIPMLWDWIYDVKEFQHKNIAIGVNGFSPRSFSRFAYAFATMPTAPTGIEDGKPSALHVKRVQQLSGHNYWCARSKPGVALCINELPGMNFGAEIADTHGGHHKQHIDDMLRSRPDLLRAFLDRDF